MRRLLAVTLLFAALFVAPSHITGAQSNTGLVVNGMDSDPDNKIWNCATNRVKFGDPSYDKSRCFTFRYQVPSGGIQSAVLHLAIKTLEASTDAVAVNVSKMAQNCTWSGNNMPCVMVQDPPMPAQSTLDINLLSIKAKEAQQDVIAQLDTGVLHGILQDDTIVYCAQLVINGGNGQKLCDANDPQGGGQAGQTGQGAFVLKTSKDTYAANEQVVVEFSGLPGNKTDWITLVAASKPDAGNYGQWFYTDGKASGTQTFSALAPGDYQVRLFLNWPSGGYTVAARYLFRVTADGASPTAGMSLQAARRNVRLNQAVLIPVTLNDATNVTNLNFDLTYDDSVVELEGDPGKGNLLDNALFSANPNESGLVRLGFAQTSGISGSGTVVNLPFRAVGKTGDRTTLELKVTTINDPNGTVLTIAQIPGEVVILNPDGTLPGSGGGSDGGGGGGGGDGGGGLPRGDCDGDARVTELDALCALEMSVKLRPEESEIMDMDGGGVTSRDAVILLKRAVGLE